MRRVYYGWILVVVLGLTTIVSYGTTQYLFGVLLVPIQQDTGWSRATISGAFSLGVIAAGLLGVPIGRLVDRRGARALMAAGSVLGGMSLLGLAHVRHVWQFYALWAGGLGLAMALTFYSVSFIVLANWFTRRRGSALALLTLLGGLASPIFIPMAGWLVVRLGWRSTLTAFGIIVLGIAFPLHAVLLRRHPEDLGLGPDGIRPDLAAAPAPSGFALPEALRQTAFWTLTVSAGLSLLGGTVVFAHQVAYMVSRGYDLVLASTLAGMVGVSSLPGRYVLNSLSDRVGPRRLLAMTLGIQAAGIVILASASSVVWLWAYVVVYGAAFGAVSPLRASIMAEQFGRRAYGAITAVQGVPMAIAAGAGPLAAGVLYDRLGSYQLALGLTAAAFAFSAVGVLLTPRHRTT